MRPGRFRIYVIGRNRRHAAPVVDAGRDQVGRIFAAEVRRRLDRHLGPQDQACRGDGPLQIRQGRLIRIGHAGVGFGAKILDNDFLDMPVRVVKVAESQKRIDPFQPCLADTDQDSARERDALAAGFRHGLQPDGRVLVGRSVMAESLLKQSW